MSTTEADHFCVATRGGLAPWRQHQALRENQVFTELSWNSEQCTLKHALTLSLTHTHTYIQRKTVDDRDTLSRYSSQYEAHLDPFAAFGAKEKQRRYTQLSGPDKATLVLVGHHHQLNYVSIVILQPGYNGLVVDWAIVHVFIVLFPCCCAIC